MLQDELLAVIEGLNQDVHNVRFSRLVAICNQFFGTGRKRGSHQIFRTPWKGDPRINLQVAQGSGGKAKPYQVRQVIQALEKLRSLQP